MTVKLHSVSERPAPRQRGCTRRGGRTGRLTHPRPAGGPPLRHAAGAASSHPSPPFCRRRLQAWRVGTAITVMARHALEVLHPRRCGAGCGAWGRRQRDRAWAGATREVGSRRFSGARDRRGAFFSELVVGFSARFQDRNCQGMPSSPLTILDAGRLRAGPDVGPERSRRKRSGKTECPNEVPGGWPPGTAGRAAALPRRGAARARPRPPLLLFLLPRPALPCPSGCYATAGMISSATHWV